MLRKYNICRRCHYAVTSKLRTDNPTTELVEVTFGFTATGVDTGVAVLVAFATVVLTVLVTLVFDTIGAGVTAVLFPLATVTDLTATGATVTVLGLTATDDGTAMISSVECYGLEPKLKRR